MSSIGQFAAAAAILDQAEKTTLLQLQPMGTQSSTDPACTSLVSWRSAQLLGPVVSGAKFVWVLSLLLLVFTLPTWSQAPVAIPLILPTGLTYDAQGNLYFAETGKNIVGKLAPDGTLSTVAGSGIQGFSGDGAPAVAADFDSPQAVAVDAAGNLFIADTHNHRIRRVDASSGIVSTVAGGGALSGGGRVQVGLPTALLIDASGAIVFADAKLHLIRRIDLGSGTISTIAGNGMQGYSGDGGPALQAVIDSPYGIALDAQGNLFLADTHNHCIRRVDHVTGTITTIAGAGLPGFSGNASPASSALLRLPRGLTLDANGNLYVVDSANHRLRRIDGVSGQIVTVAGDETEGFAGVSGAGPSASLDSPRGVALSPAGLATFSDTLNQAIRQVNAAGLIQTIAGPGRDSNGPLNLVVSANPVYGSGQAVATITSGAASGNVTLVDAASGPVQQLASAPLVANAATFSLAALAAGVHRLSAVYGGDSSHPAIHSALIAVTIASLRVTATPNAVAMVFGQAVPLLTSSLAGILPQDQQTISLVLSSFASSSAVSGTYPITGLLAGAAAANYALVSTPAAVTIGKAGVSTTLSRALAVHVTSSTTGVPAGQVMLIDGATAIQTASLNASGDCSFSASTLSLGSHTLTAAYTGNSNFLPAVSLPQMLTSGPAAQADFSLASSGQSSASVVAGGAATFSFLVAPVQGALNSPIQLSATGLPPGASASFSPAYLPPDAGPSNFTLTVQTVKTVAMNVTGREHELFNAALGSAFAFALPLLLVGKRRRRVVMQLALCGVCGLGMTVLNGCGNRTNVAGAGAAVQIYTITVTATAATDSGSALLHTTSVDLSVR